MPIRRKRAPDPELAHAAFLQAMREAERPRDRNSAQATFLTLRLLDHWLKLGADIASARGRAYRATAAAVARVDDAEVKEPLAFVLRAMLMLREPDAQPLLRRLIAFGELHEGRGQFAAAAGLYAMVARLAAPGEHEAVSQALIRRGFCLRALGEFEWAGLAYGEAAAIARRGKDEWRTLVAQLGSAKVLLAAGRVRAADAAMRELAGRFERRYGPSRTPVTPVVVRRRARGKK